MKTLKYLIIILVIAAFAACESDPALPVTESLGVDNDLMGTWKSDRLEKKYSIIDKDYSKIPVLNKKDSRGKDVYKDTLVVLDSLGTRNTNNKLVNFWKEILTITQSQVTGRDTFFNVWIDTLGIVTQKAGFEFKIPNGTFASFKINDPDGPIRNVDRTLNFIDNTNALTPNTVNKTITSTYKVERNRLELRTYDSGNNTYYIRTYIK